MAVSNTDSHNPSKEIKIATSGVVKQPLHVTLIQRKKEKYYINKINVVQSPGSSIISACKCWELGLGMGLFQCGMLKIWEWACG